MIIENAKQEEIDEIKEIYNKAKSFMDSSGNESQWKNGYPTKEMLLKDIEENNLYVLKENNKILGVFCFFVGIDITRHLKLKCLTLKIKNFKFASNLRENF